MFVVLCFIVIFLNVLIKCGLYGDMCNYRGNRFGFINFDWEGDVYLSELDPYGNFTHLILGYLQGLPFNSVILSGTYDYNNDIIYAIITDKNDSSTRSLITINSNDIPKTQYNIDCCIYNISTNIIGEITYTNYSSISNGSDIIPYMAGLSYDCNNDILYGITGTARQPRKTLFEINTINAVATRIGPEPTPHNNLNSGPVNLLVSDNIFYSHDRASNTIFKFTLDGNIDRELKIHHSMTDNRIPFGHSMTYLGNNNILLNDENATMYVIDLKTLTSIHYHTNSGNNFTIPWSSFSILFNYNGNNVYNLCVESCYSNIPLQSKNKSMIIVIAIIVISACIILLILTLVITLKHRNSDSNIIKEQTEFRCNVNSAELSPLPTNTNMDDDDDAEINAIIDEHNRAGYTSNEGETDIETDNEYANIITPRGNDDIPLNEDNLDIIRDIINNGGTPGNPNEYVE